MKQISLILCLFIIGCNNSTDLGQSIASDLGNVRNQIVSAKNDLAQATSKLDSALGSTNEAAINAQTISNDLAQSQQALEAERKHWVGYRSRMAIYWIMGLFAAYWVVTAILGIFGGSLGSRIATAMVSIPLAGLNLIVGKRSRQLEGSNAKSS